MDLGGWMDGLHKKPSYDTKMLMKVGFDKTAFGKFGIITLNKTLMKQI
jgi:hypothetical protein